MITRRSFLKKSAAATAVACVPFSSLFTKEQVEIIHPPDGEPTALVGHHPVQSFNTHGWVGDYVYISDNVKGFHDPIFKEAYGYLRPSLMKLVPRHRFGSVEWIILNPRPTDYDPLAQRGLIGWRSRFSYL